MHFRALSYNSNKILLLLLFAANKGLFAAASRQNSNVNGTFTNYLKNKKNSFLVFGRFFANVKS